MTSHGRHSDAEIDQAVESSRFLPPKQCNTSELWPSKVTFVGFYQSKDDINQLEAVLKEIEQEMATLRSTYGPGLNLIVDY